MSRLTRIAQLLLALIVILGASYSLASASGTITYYNIGVGTKLDCGDSTIANATSALVYIDGAYYKQGHYRQVKYVLEGDGNYLLVQRFPNSVLMVASPHSDCTRGKFGRPGIVTPASYQPSKDAKTNDFTLALGKSLYCDGLALTNLNKTQVVFNGKKLDFPAGEYYDITFGDYSVVFTRAWLNGKIFVSTNMVCSNKAV